MRRWIWDGGQVVGTRLAPWLFGTSLGPVWDKFGTSLGQVWDQFGTSLGPGWDPSWDPGWDPGCWDQFVTLVGTSLGPVWDQFGTSSGPWLELALDQFGTSLGRTSLGPGWDPGCWDQGRQKRETFFGVKREAIVGRIGKLEFAVPPIIPEIC
jgi:hypothetical protein